MWLPVLRLSLSSALVVVEEGLTLPPPPPLLALTSLCSLGHTSEELEAAEKGSLSGSSRAITRLRDWLDLEGLLSECYSTSTGYSCSGGSLSSCAIDAQEASRSGGRTVPHIPSLLAGILRAGMRRRLGLAHNRRRL